MRRLAVWLAAATVLLAASPAAARERSGTQAARQETRQRQEALLVALWPGRVAVLCGGTRPVRDWAETDRLYVWTRTLVREAGLGGAAATAGSLRP